MKINSKISIDNITFKEIQILLTLHQHPFGTFEELAEITHIPKTTVYEIIQKIKPVFWVAAIPNLANLGLTTYDVFSEVNSLVNLTFLEKIGQKHPYIYYYARIYGKITGIYFQFRAPLELGKNLELLFRELKSQNKIKNFTMLHFPHQFLITPFNLTLWNPENFTWKFNWKNWFQIAEFHKDPQKEYQKQPSFPAYDVKSWIQRRDIALLNKLITNARRPNTKLREELNNQGFQISDSIICRRRKKLELEAIYGYKVQIDPHLFDVVNTVLIWGYGPEKFLKSITIRLENHPIPFYSVFNIEKFTIYWYLHLPTHQLSDLLHILQENLYELHFMYVDYPKSNVFSLDPDAFDEKKHDWKKSSEFVIYDLLKKVED
ncbi:MAG: hypothetical protein ACTSX0_04215 [Promethearchaeota archaeon]